MISVIIADNHPLFRSGVRQLIETSAGFVFLDEASDCENCLIKVQQHQPDLLLLDLNMPVNGGFDVVKRLKAQNSRCQIVILSMHASRAFVETAQQLGCAGFIAKEDAGPDLILALNRLHSGFQMSSSVGREETTPLRPHITKGVDLKALSHLTPTELGVLVDIAKSATSNEIAQKMGTSSRTVETHRQNISRKLELSGANSLVRYAAENRQIIEGLSGTR